MTINPTALLPSKMTSVAASRRAAPVVADLEQPAHVEPLYNVVKVLFNYSVLAFVSHIIFCNVIKSARTV